MAALDPVHVEMGPAEESVLTYQGVEEEPVEGSALERIVAVREELAGARRPEALSQIRL